MISLFMLRILMLPPRKCHRLILYALMIYTVGNIRTSKLLSLNTVTLLLSKHFTI